MDWAETVGTFGSEDPLEGGGAMGCGYSGLSEGWSERPLHRKKEALRKDEMPRTLCNTQGIFVDHSHQSPGPRLTRCSAAG